MNSIIVNNKKLSQMTLGTVQLGMNYGIANDSGQPVTKQSHAMLGCALKNGVTSLDTARGYGTSEDVLGSFFKIHSTEMPFITSKVKVGVSVGASDKDIEKDIITSVETSLQKLGISKLDCLLLHSPDDMIQYGDIVPKTLEKLVKDRYTAMVGASVYLPQEVETLLKNDVYEAIQLPMSLFDQKLIHQGYIERLKEKNIIVFVRSVFLQGLFFLDPEKITDPLLIEYASPYIRKLRELSEASGMSIAEFAISFIRDVPGVTSLVLGADTEEQVIENISYMNASPLTDKVRNEVSEIFKNVNIEKIMEVLRRPK